MIAPGKSPFGNIVQIGAFQLTPSESRVLNRTLNVPPGQELLHYMQVGHFIQLLEKRTFWMRRLDLQRGDPQDGRPPAATLANPMSILEQAGFNVAVDLSAFNESNKAERMLSYTHCWVWTGEQNQYMWDFYGHYGTGVCIKTRKRRLDAAVRPNATFWVEVYGETYCGEDEVLPLVHSAIGLTRKEERFRREDEVRVLARYRIEAIPNDVTPEHIELPIDTNVLIENIYMGPNADANATDLVRSAVKKAAISSIVREPCIASFESVRLKEELATNAA